MVHFASVGYLQQNVSADAEVRVLNIAMTLKVEINIVVLSSYLPQH